MAIYTLGSNGSGQLGIGHLDDVSAPTRHLPHPTVQGLSLEPVRVAGGGNHTLVLYSNRELFITGITQSQAKIREASSKTQEKATILLARNVTACSTTWEASTFVTSTNSVVTCGKGAKGELGRGEEVTEFEAAAALMPLDSNWIPEDCSIRDLASGVQHTVIVLSNGDVYGWGNGRKGQLGEPAELVWHPRRITGLGFKAARAVCGREFTFILAENGEAILLGSDKWRVRSNMPSYGHLQGWTDVGASWGSIYVLCDSRSIISWGRNDHGQLAPSGLPLVHKIAIGSEHALALTEDGQVLAWGWGEHGNCGTDLDENGDVKNHWNTLHITDEPDSTVTGIWAGCATSWLLT